MSDYILYHHGIKGMHWGVRRFQNKDGTLTPKGKKRIHNQYVREQAKGDAELTKNYTRLYVNAHNKTADYMNERYNEKQRKKYGDDFMNRSDYGDKFNATAEKQMQKNLSIEVYDFIRNNENYNNAKNLVKQYDMIAWDDVARDNSAFYDTIKRNKTN